MPSQPPLTGLKVLELAGLAPGPFAGLLLADAGASVLRIDRPSSPSSAPSSPATDLLTRNKTSIALDLKNPRGAALLLSLAREADVLIDPYRPGVLEALGLGPSVLCRLNPRLVYARLTGFRRDASSSRFSAMAGHDINYLAVSGVLALLGRKGQPPTPPGNLLGDFAGGGVMLVLGVLMALLVRERSGRGQVVEGNMVDGVGYLGSFARFALKTPAWDRERGENLLDSGCPWYECYETKDGKWMAVGALEERFFGELVRGLGLAGQGWEEGRRYDRGQWPELRRVLEEAFGGKTRDEWERVFAGTDACCTPVYEYGEMERDRGKEGDQRPAVTLRETPWLAVRKDAENASHGQGPGVEGEGYVGRPLEPGHGGEETLKEWLGWSKGKQFDVEEGGLVLKEKPKL
ncbi:CoA-transferase family III domain-containing protein [Parachaetomium inaequale]|uniref:CoA-transferase family III domain-containing protein n=1 Tax=Parachaetomium inaequale TaxID=2588326 RepID=A0AAN6SUI6_9PEZI|nr:CoA-transferase family III domain-containing protein [Parachaetomium inaequale]